MKIFEIKNESGGEGGKFVAFHTDYKTDALLMLAGIAKRMSKSAVIRHATERYLGQSSPVPMVANLAYWKWKSLGQPSISQFKKQIESDLNSKRVTEELIKEVIIVFEQLCNENK